MCLHAAKWIEVLCGVEALDAVEMLVID